MKKGKAARGPRQASTAGAPVFLAGGGAGAKTLALRALADEQHLMFKRTLEVTPFQRKMNEQEVRQTQIWQRTGSVTVNVSREDFPELTANVPVDFVYKDAQLQWLNFLAAVKKALEIEYIDRIIDRSDSSIVLRIMSLVPNGKYFVRQKEQSSVLDLVSTGKKPAICTYKSLDGIKEAQLEISAAGRYQDFIDDKTKTLLGRQMTYIQEFSASAKVLKATRAREITELVDYFTQVKNAGDDIAAAAAIPPPGGDHWLVASAAEVTTHIDLITLHRVALESLNRLALQSPEKRGEVARDALAFTLAAIRTYRGEVDGLLLALKLLTEMAPDLYYLTTDGMTDVYWEVMETIQLYGPESPAYRGPVPTPMRVVKAAEAAARRAARDEARRLAAAEAAAMAAADEEARAWQRVVAAAPEKDAPEEPQQADAAEAPPADAGATTESSDVLPPLPSLGAQLNNAPPTASLPATARSTSTAAAAAVKKPRAWKGSVGVGTVGKKKEIPVEVVVEVVEEKVMSKEERYATLLPKVQGAKFSGLARLGPKSFKRTLVLTQAYATLFKLVGTSFANRALAMDLGLHLEVADMAFLCEAAPGVLSYAFWVIDALWNDAFGFGTVNDLFRMFDAGAAGWAALDDEYEVVDLPLAFLHQKGHLSGVDLLRVFHAGVKAAARKREQEEEEKAAAATAAVPVSAVEEKAAEEEGQPGEAVEHGPQEEEEDDTVPAAAAEEAATMNDGDGDRPPPADNDDTPPPLLLQPGSTPSFRRPRRKVVYGLEMEDRPGSPRLVVSREVLNACGYHAFRDRYLRRPPDNVVVAVALASWHFDVPPADRATAALWLRHWDDGTPRFTYLKKRGEERSGCTFDFGAVDQELI